MALNGFDDVLLKYFQELFIELDDPIVQSRSNDRCRSRETHSEAGFLIRAQ